MLLDDSLRGVEVVREWQDCFFDLALRMSADHKAYFVGLYPPNEHRLAEFQAQAEESLHAQERTEACDSVPFEEYLRRYLAD